MATPSTEKRIAVVTGSNRGLGYAICQRLAAQGTIHVIMTSRKEAEGLAARQTLVDQGLDVTFHTLDVNDPASIQTLVEWIKATYGRVDIVTYSLR